MLQKYRLVFNAVILIAATFFFTPSQAIAAPACPEYMPNKYCNTFKTNCDRGKKPACNQLIRQKRANKEGFRGRPQMMSPVFPDFLIPSFDPFPTTSTGNFVFILIISSSNFDPFPPKRS